MSKKSKTRTKTPRCLLEKNRYQAIIVDDKANRLERRAAKAMKRKVKKSFLTLNIINGSFDIG